MTEPNVIAPANIIVVCGSSGSGKSSWTKGQLRRKPRVIVWDADAEYVNLDGFVYIDSLADLARQCRKKEQGRLAFVPARSGNQQEFGVWSQIAFAWGRCVAVAEETADVTNPGKAPPGWGELVRRGRKREITLYAITQRPAESDKTAFTNASMLHVGNLNRYQDRVYISRELDCAETEIAALKPLDWIERDRRTGALRKGRLSF